MTYRNPDAEDALEHETIKLFADLGWETADCYHEKIGAQSRYGRQTRTDVVLPDRLRSALLQLNPNLSPAAIGAALEELTRDRHVMGAIQANREIYDLLKNGVKVTFQNDDGEQQT